MNILGMENRFEKLAEIAANKYLNDKVPLNDSIIKLAEEKELNPEQIKRVVESANVKVFQKHFSDDDREGHKDVDFDVADPKVIIKKIYVIKPMPEASDVTEHVSSPLDFFKDLSMDSFHDKEESDVADLPCEKHKTNRPTLIIRIKTAKQNLEKNAYIESEKYLKKVAEVSKKYLRTTGGTEDFQALCKEAYEHKGEAIKGVLESIAQSSKQVLPVFEEYQLSKVAGFASDKLEEVFSLEKIANAHYRYKKASDLAQEQLDEMSK